MARNRDEQNGGRDLDDEREALGDGHGRPDHERYRDVVVLQVPGDEAPDCSRQKLSRSQGATQKRQICRTANAVRTNVGLL